VATVIRVDERVIGGGSIIDTSTLKRLSAMPGQGLLPSLRLQFTNGTGSGAVNKFHLSRRTLATVTYDLIDLAGGLTDLDGAAITFTAIKRILVVMTAPDGTASLRIGPQNQSNPWAGPWGGTGATVYETIVWRKELLHPYAGWTVTAGTGDIFPIYNPGASSVTYCLWIMGLG